MDHEHPDATGPRWLALTVGTLAVVLGATLTLRPYSSLEALTIFVAAALVVTGFGELLDSRGDARPWTSRMLGAVLIITGVLVVALPGLSASSVAIIAGAGLIVAGLTRLAAVVRREVRAVEWWIALLGGVATVVLGVLAVAWPDVTTLVIALLIGPAAVILGVRQIVRAWRGAGDDRHAPRWLRLGGAAAALILAGALAAVSGAIHDRSPQADDFYATPDDLPARPGQLLRSEPATNGVPEGAAGRRILYTTTDGEGRVIPASGMVLTPQEIYGPLPVLLWEHGTTGVARDCGPSVLDEPFEAGGMPVVPQGVERGWAIVAPDYPGLGAEGRHPYLVGVPAARSALDAVRAARQLDGVSLGPRTVVWGHSQGGGAALWTGVEAADYAPDVPLAGVAALAPASDVVSLIRGVQDSPTGQLFGVFTVFGYDAAYPDVRRDDYLRGAALPAARGIAARCLSEPATLLSLPSVLVGEPLFARDLTTGPMGERLAENVPDERTRVPTFLGQGLDDPLVLPPVQERFARALCAKGQPLRYREYPGRDHLSVVAEDSPMLPELVRWTTRRFAGDPVTTRCPE